MSHRRGKVIIIVAPSGAGKSTLVKRLMDELSILRFSVSATTRQPRPGEIHGKEYYFLTLTDFNKKIEEGDFLEWEEFYGGKRYGTLRSDVENQLDKGYFCVLDIEVKGALNVKTIFKEDAVSIFIKPPSLEILRQRLENRGTESPESLKERLERAEMELQYESSFDFCVVNDDLETAYTQVKQILETFINAN
ncbi:guanylate kinase [bacterium]|nr:MAG: guanylate kinase [bacterium]